MECVFLYPGIFTVFTDSFPGSSFCRPWCFLSFRGNDQISNCTWIYLSNAAKAFSRDCMAWIAEVVASQNIKGRLLGEGFKGYKFK